MLKMGARAPPPVFYLESCALNHRHPPHRCRFSADSCQFMLYLVGMCIPIPISTSPYPFITAFHDSKPGPQVPNPVSCSLYHVLYHVPYCTVHATCAHNIAVKAGPISRRAIPRPHHGDPSACLRSPVFLSGSLSVFPPAAWRRPVFPVDLPLRRHE